MFPPGGQDGKEGRLVGSRGVHLAGGEGGGGSWNLN